MKRFSAPLPLLFAVALVFGIAGMNFWDFVRYDWADKVLLGALAALCMLLALLMVRSSWKQRKGVLISGGTKAFVLLAMLACAVLGALRYQLRFNDIRRAAVAAYNDACGIYNNIKGVVVDEPVQKRASLAVRVKTDDGANLLVYLLDKAEKDSLAQREASVDSVPAVAADSLAVGDSIVFTRLEAFRPTCRFDNTEGADFAAFRNYLFNSGIAATCLAPAASWRKTANGGAMPWRISSLSHRMKRVRGTMRRAYGDTSLRGNALAIVAAMTLGQRDGMSKDLRQQFARSGVSHVLALSGFHLTIIYMVLRMFFLPLCLTLRSRRFAQIFILLIMWGFVMLTDAPPSLVRAASMCTIMSVASLRDGRQHSLTSLSLAAIIMLLYNPQQLFDVGFQLSFLSMLSLTTVNPMLVDKPKRGNFWRSKLKAFCLMPVSCTMFTMPLVAYYFGIVPTLSLVSNLLITLLAYLLMIFVVLWWAAFFYAPLQDLLGKGISFVATLMDSTTAYISSIEWSAISWHPSILGVLCSYLLLFIVYLILRRLRLL